MPRSTSATDRRISARHLGWIRSLPCAVPGCHGDGIQAHHVREASAGGTALKPHDRWAVPLCRFHHAQGHTLGWQTFKQCHGIDLRAHAEFLARVSPVIGREPGAEEFL